MGRRQKTPPPQQAPVRRRGRPRKATIPEQTVPVVTVTPVDPFVLNDDDSLQTQHRILRYRRFWREYLSNGMNSKKAAIAAGYGAAWADRQGWRMIEDCRNSKTRRGDELRRALEIEKQAAAEMVGLHQEQIYGGLRAVLTATVTDYLEQTPDGGLRLADLSLTDTRAISSLKIGKNGEISLKLESKEAALRLSAGLLGLLREKVEHSGEIKLVPAQAAGEELGALGAPAGDDEDE